MLSRLPCFCSSQPAHVLHLIRQEAAKGRWNVAAFKNRSRWSASKGGKSSKGQSEVKCFFDLQINQVTNEGVKEKNKKRRTQTAKKRILWVSEYEGKLNWKHFSARIQTLQNNWNEHFGWFWGVYWAVMWCSTLTLKTFSHIRRQAAPLFFFSASKATTKSNNLLIATV